MTLSTATFDGSGEFDDGAGNDRPSDVTGGAGPPGAGGVAAGDSPLSKACKKDGMAGAGMPAPGFVTIGGMPGIGDGPAVDIGGGKSLPTGRLGRLSLPLSEGNTFWDRCYDFKNIFAEKNCKKLAFLTHNKAKLCNNFDHNIGF
jgi:hypothetical protein